MADEQIQVRLFLTARQISLLASCAEIGHEGAADNHEENDGENSQVDLDEVANTIAHLKDVAEAALPSEGEVDWSGEGVALSEHDVDEPSAHRRAIAGIPDTARTKPPS